MEMLTVADKIPFFWSKVEKGDECWLWLGSLNQNGYGRFWLNGKTIPAHRFSYELHVGRIDEGLLIDHTCHTRNCVRPEHLRQVTNKQNGENRAGLPRHNKSGVRGVYWSKANGKWRGLIRHNGKGISVGLFDDLREAEAAVVARRNQLFTHNDIDKAVS